MDSFTKADLADLVAERPGPKVSIYMPTTRGGSPADRVRFRKALGAAEDRLREYGLNSGDVQTHLAPLRSVQADEAFWSHASDGLAAFIAPEFQRTYRLPWAFPEDAADGDLFHVLPLVPHVVNDGKYFVLAVSQNRVRLLRGNQATLWPVDVPGLPHNLDEANRTHDVDEVLTFHTRPTSGGTWGAIFEGHGVGIDDKKDDLLRYFRQIDRAVHPILRDEQAPLIPAMVEYLMPIYREANGYAHLVDGGMPGNPDRLDTTELHDRAWAVIAPRFRAAEVRAVAKFRQMAGTGLASADELFVFPEAAAGNVDTLMVVMDGPGMNGGSINAAVVHTLRHRGSVFTLPTADMPDRHGLAAIFRRPPSPPG